MGVMSKRKKKRKKVKQARPTQAEKADKYELYLASVQDAEHEIEFFDDVYLSFCQRKPRVLREDFCGTFAVCCEWVKSGRDRVAIGVDIDPEPLDWGRQHNLAKLPPDAQQRVTLLQDDVRSNSSSGADILAAQNFSFWIFKTRAELLEYLRIAHDNLADDGMMILDMMGGGECYEANEDVRKIKNFKYVWEQHSYNPINHEASFYIHFRFNDGSELKRIFGYHWRFWTIPEVRELLAEAGFSASHVYWEGTDANGEGDGNFKKTIEAESDPSWIAYIVALK